MEGSRSTLLATLLIFIALLQTAATASKCGPQPTEVFVKKGEKKHVRFWSEDDAASALEGSGLDGLTMVNEEEQAENSFELNEQIAIAEEEKIEPDDEDEVEEEEVSETDETEVVPTVAADTTPLIVTAGGPEVQTPPPLYDTQPHIILPDAPPLAADPAEEDDVKDTVVTFIVNKSSEEREKADEQDEAEDGFEAEGSGIVSDGEALKAEEAADGELLEIEGSAAGNDTYGEPQTTTERQFMTTNDPYDLIATETGTGPSKSILTASDIRENEIEGSGDEKLPASATIPLNKYQEIRVHYEGSGEEITYDSDGSGDTSFMLDPEEGEDTEFDRLLHVVGFSGDGVLKPLTPEVDETANSLQNDEVGEGSGAIPFPFPTADVPVLDEVDQNLVPVTGDEHHEQHLNDDELLPVAAKPTSIHDLLNSISPAADLQASSSEYLPVYTDFRGFQVAPPPARPHQVQSSPGDVGGLERLLQVKEFASGDRVILVHVDEDISVSEDASTTAFLDQSEEMSAPHHFNFAESSGAEADGQAEPSQDHSGDGVDVLTDVQADGLTEQYLYSIQQDQVTQEIPISEGSGVAADEPFSYQPEEAVIEEQSLVTPEGSGDGTGPLLESPQPALYQSFDPQAYKIQYDGSEEGSGELDETLENKWITEEAKIDGSGLDLPHDMMIELETEAEEPVPSVKATQPVAQIAEGELPAHQTDLPTAETEGVSFSQSPSAELEPEKAADGEDILEGSGVSPTVSVGDEEEKATSEQSDIPKPSEQVDAQSEEPSSDESTSPENDSDEPARVRPDRETLLNSIYRIIQTHNSPNYIAPTSSQPVWVDYSQQTVPSHLPDALLDPLRPYPTKQALPTEQTVIVGQGPYFEISAGQQRRPAGTPLLDTWDPYSDTDQSSSTAPEAAPGTQVHAAHHRDDQLTAQPDPEPEATFDTDRDAEEKHHILQDGLMRFIDAQPYPLRSALMTDRPHPRRVSRDLTEAAPVDCEWNIKTESHLYLLVTVHNLSAPYTVDCAGAYIEVERENDGFEARWCGNRVRQSGSRPHMVFARSEVRIAVYNDGTNNELPTGFDADVEVVDLLDARQYASFRRSGLNFRRLIQDPVLPVA